MRPATAKVHKHDLDSLDKFGYWCFRAALLIVFVVWLVRQVAPEVKAAWHELHSEPAKVEQTTPKVVPKPSP
jgi:hypothetical protein